MPGYDDKNIIGLLRSRIEDRFEGSWANSVSITVPSDSADEEYGFFGGYQKMREWVGRRQLQTIAQKQYRIANKPFESSIEIFEKDLQREKTGLLDAHINRWVDGTVNGHWEDLITDLIVTNGNCYDGTPFFGDAHKWGSEAAQKNQIAAADVAALNVADAAVPTPLEMSQAILGMIGWMLTFTDNADRDINGSARDFMVIVNTVNHFSAAMQALNSNLLTGLVDNPLTGMKQGGFNIEVKMIRRATGSNKLRLLRKDGDLKPFILQPETELDFTSTGRGSDSFFERKVFKYGVDCRRGAGYGLWESALEATLS